MAVHRRRAGSRSSGGAFEISGGAPELKALAKHLKDAGPQGKELRKELRKAIVVAVKPMRDEAKRNAKNIPVEGKKQTGLRREVAKAIRYKVGVSSNPFVRLEVNPSKFAGAGRGLPGMMEYAKPKWRHPLFGNEDKWYDQESHPYLEPAVEAHKARLRSEIDDAVNDTSKKIERI